MAVFAELFSAKGVGVLYRATTGTMTVDWKPVHAFPSKEAAEAQTKLEAAEFRQAFYRVAVHEMGIHPDMVWVPPWEFQLGSPDEESERYADEGPQQLTIIPVGFWVHKYEVTQAEYIDLMGNNPSFGYNADSGELAADLPVDSVTWEEAREYCRRFNERELKAGRVPVPRGLTVLEIRIMSPTLANLADWAACVSRVQAISAWPGAWPSE